MYTSVWCHWKEEDLMGARRSTTLMPVTRISCSTDISTKSGASAWIAEKCSVGMGPRSSIGSPVHSSFT
ncbi:hypothetical protein E2C01_092230 [Portunus trituberculatus]|uniref:Uncharacterized protein n=1 Tax=Portunus trituberculatus TaxID=210409 RepID=A0A5B7JV91_PORTR|nr:hypothetical protein [Portunus trituberculatus]